LSSLRLWLIALAVMFFGAGLASGVLLERRLEPPPERRGEDFERLFVRTFDLEPARARLFRELMRNYEKDKEDIRQRALSDSMAQMEPQLVRLELIYRELVRDSVLPEERRQEFDQLSRYRPWSSGS